MLCQSLLLLLLYIVSINSEAFKVLKNRDVAKNFISISLILDAKNLSKPLCLRKCISNKNCLTVVFNEKIEGNNCFLFNRYFNTQNETIYSKYSSLNEKNSHLVKNSNNLNSLLNVFQYFKLNFTIDSYPVFHKFIILQGSGTIIDDIYSTSKNYVLDGGNSRHAINPSNGKIIEFNENWKFITYKTAFYFPNHMISVNNSVIYITGYSNVYKADKYLNLIQSFYSNSSDFTDLFYNEYTNTLFVVSYFQETVYEFDINLNVVGQLTTPKYVPYSVQGLDNQLYVGTTTGEILVFANGVMSQIIQVQKGLSTVVTSILFDEYGYMAAACGEFHSLYLYYTNGSFTGMNLTTYAQYPQNIRFDSNGNFVVVSNNQIDIYN